MDAFIWGKKIHTQVDLRLLNYLCQERILFTTSYFYVQLFFLIGLSYWGLIKK